jgi:hypothetical protein
LLHRCSVFCRPWLPNLPFERTWATAKFRLERLFSVQFLDMAVFVLRAEQHITIWIAERTGKTLQNVKPSTLSMVEGVLCANAPFFIERST